MPLPDGRLLEIEFDFIDHLLRFNLNSGQRESLPLMSQSIADFFADYMNMLRSLGVAVRIEVMPVVCVNPVAFDRDTLHKVYDSDSVQRFWHILCRVDALFKLFSTGFLGKISPVHFFWGSFDLAVTRFNGRKAPPREGADAIQSEAYSHECISAGFWPGNGGYGRAAFYCYAAPVPAGLDSYEIPGPGAFDKTLGEFLLPYEDVWRSDRIEHIIIAFLQSTYSVCANAARWDRESLDRAPAPGSQPIQSLGTNNRLPAAPLLADARE